MSDRGAPGADFKQALAEILVREIQRQGMTQARAAELLGLPKSRVSEIVNGRLQSISEQRLLEALAAVGFAVELRLRRAEPGSAGRWTIVEVEP